MHLTRPLLVSLFVATAGCAGSAVSSSSHRQVAPATEPALNAAGGANLEDAIAAAVAASDSSNAQFDSALARAAAELDAELAALRAADAADSLAGGMEPEGDAVLAFASLPLEPYASNARVTHYLRLFTGTAGARMGERLARGSRYEEMIRGKLRAGGIPEEFYYLALIESGYDPHAYSRAAAVGMWQFMASTARKSGLRVSWWIDDRRDPFRSTDAAIRFLNELNGQFGSMYLAAAAYNGGPGRVSRGLSSLARQLQGVEPDDQFFRLASTNLLRDETRNYVPQLIAAALVGRDPLSFGITVDTLPPLVFDSVAVPALTGLPAVARACDSELATIRELNGHILRGMIPPGVEDEWVRVPVGCAETFHDAFALLDEADRAGARTHISKRGETPNAVAKIGGITLATLRKYNPAVKTAAASALPVGTRLLLPSRETVAAGRDVPDPSIERWGGAAAGGGGGFAVNNVYVVRSGDTLGGIAQRNGTTVANLKRVNGLTSDRIAVGQRIRIRG